MTVGFKKDALNEIDDLLASVSSLIFNLVFTANLINSSNLLGFYYISSISVAVKTSAALKTNIY